jgi:transaldolase
MNRLTRLYDEFGQSPWLDNLQRGYLTSGQLADLRSRGVRGLTSNPTIFQKAIQGSPDYDEQFRALADEANPVIDDYWALVLADIRGAAAVFAPVYEASEGHDGFVSVEVDPGLAHDAAGTLDAARELHTLLSLPNVMIKIPATREGLPCIREMIAEGRNVNVTLIFSLERYEEVMEAYIQGLEARAATPDADLSTVASVASFFISRVDTEIDRRLDAIGSPEALPPRPRRRGAGQARLPAVRADVLRPALGRPRRSRGARPAPAVGEHVDEEPGVPRHALRRQPHRPVDGEHAARRHA